MLGRVGLSEDLARIAGAAAAFAAPGERVVAVLASEPASGLRTYVCAYETEDGERSWLALDADGAPVRQRNAVREAVSIAAMCEIAEESAGGGDLEELRSQLVTLRLTENPPGIADAEEAALALERVVEAPPRLASPDYLDALGAATLRLERALGDDPASPFAAAMRQALPVVDELMSEVERGYKVELA
jgi:hypothetical protein